MKLLNDVVSKAALMKIGETYRASFLSLNELLLEVTCSEFGDDTQLFTFTFLLQLFIALLVFLYIDLIFGCEPAQGFGIAVRAGRAQSMTVAQHHRDGRGDVA